MDYEAIDRAMSVHVVCADQNGRRFYLNSAGHGRSPNPDDADTFHDSGGAAIAAAAANRDPRWSGLTWSGLTWQPVALFAARDSGVCPIGGLAPLYRCADPDCPGRPFRASDTPHSGCKP